MRSVPFNRFAAISACLAGIFGFLYAVAFIIISRNNPVLGTLFSALFLLLGGLLAIAPLVQLYRSFRELDSGFALFALGVALMGAMGMLAHGGYDLANALHPPTLNLGNLASLPSQIDPRGLFTFGATGLGLFFNAWLMRRSSAFPPHLASLGYLAAALLLILYLGRLIVLDPANPVVLYPALASGFVVSPLWYLWLAVVLFGK